MRTEAVIFRSVDGVHSNQSFHWIRMSQCHALFIPTSDTIFMLSFYYGFVYTLRVLLWPNWPWLRLKNDRCRGFSNEIGKDRLRANEQNLNVLGKHLQHGNVTFVA